MKRANKSKPVAKKEQQNSFRSRTKVPGQNPRANDDPSHDEHHDESRKP